MPSPLLRLEPAIPSAVARVHLIFGALALTLGVLAALGQNWVTAVAMLLLLIGQVLGYYNARRARADKS